MKHLNVLEEARLVVTHSLLGEHANTQRGLAEDPFRLKTLLETGETLTKPGSLMYAQDARQPA